jgi:SNF2 family DNA or RNA helicase
MSALYVFQQDGAAFLAAMTYAYLADEMRLGKTPQAVDAWSQGMGHVQSVVVVCPAYLRINWRREIARWAWLPGLSTRVLGYEEVVRDGLPEADVYVIDEAHYVMNPHARRTQAVLGFAPTGELLADHPLRRAKHVWALSGTPGNPSQMWPVLRVFGATKLTWQEWTYRYCHTRMTDYGVQVMGVRHSMLGELKEIMGRYVLRRTAKHVGLPEARWGVLTLDCGVDNEDRRAQRWYDPEADDLPVVDEAIATKMRKLGERKVEPIVAALTEELASGELDKIVVFAWHLNVLRGLDEGLKPFGARKLDGATHELTKQLFVDQFMDDPAHRVLVCQHKVGGVGWDFSAASDVLFAELSWNPDDNTQAAARVLGPRQTRPVMVRIASSEDSLDYAVARVTARKQETLKATWS